VVSNVGACLARAPCMATEQDRAPLSTEVSPLETEVDLHPSDRRQAETSDERLTIGQMLSGRYRIERVLGQGGMGVVYLATDEQVAGETFAIKVLKRGLDPQALELLREEVRKTRKLSHPNIVDVHSVNVDGTELYVLMEYLEGKSLNALLDEEFGRGMTFSHAWPIIEDVGAALGFAHDHNVTHSDLKPANVFVTTSGRTKLLDFGIARVSRGPLLHARSGPLALTPAYASCEMLEGKEADPRDDIYSFACVIYEMLSGKRPFEELTALEAREAGAQVSPLAVLSRDQNAALARALAFDRAGRTGSVEALLAGLVVQPKPRGRTLAILAAVAIVALAALGYLVLDKLWTSRHSIVVQSVPGEAQPAAARAATFNPPPHSIAVLPFVNISGDKEQEYFSDGLTEELLNSLAEINEFQVAARTSAFSFKGKDADIGTIARKLNVGAVLEGSVRRSGNTVRITTQLINAVTGFHLWSHTYDRDLGDVLKLETEIANAVASALKVSLLADVATKIELGGTRNPAAFDAYLRGRKAHVAARSDKDYQTAITAYTEAIRLDPTYALAFANRSLALSSYALEVSGPVVRESFAKALNDARNAITLTPDLAEGRLALATHFEQGSLDFTRADQEHERALALAPGNAEVLSREGRFAVYMGRIEAGIAAARRAVVLDPLNRDSHRHLGQAFYFERRNKEAIAALQDTLTLDPEYSAVYAERGLAYYALGDFERARTSCESKPDYWLSQQCLALTYDKLGRHADAEAILAKMQAANGDDAAFQYAEIYAQWGNRTKALEWLETALRVRDAGLIQLKIAALLDPLRNEPRFQAIERELKFPPQ
jgi:eukaryotic-like serine/threonine-protein kinase